MLNATVQLYKNAYKGLSSRMWLLSLVMLINRSGTMVIAFITLYCTFLGYSIEKAGFVVAIYGSGSVIGGLLGGRLSDVFGFYYTQFCALFFGGILFIVLGMMKTYEGICTVAFLLSIVNESFRPANAMAISHYSTPESRTQSFSLIRLAINLGWGIGSALGGLLASIDYHLLFWVDGGTNIAAAFLLLRMLPTITLKQQRNASHHSENKNNTVSPYQDKPFLVFLILIVLFAFCFFQLFATVPLFFKSELRLSEFWIGVVMSGNGLLIAFFEMVIVYKLERTTSYLFLMATGTLLMGISFAMLHLPVAGLLIAVLFTGMITFSEMIAMPFMNSYYISRSTLVNRGSYAGLYTMSWSIAQIAGSSIGALIAAKSGFNFLWWVILIICVITAAGFRLLARLG